MLVEADNLVTLEEFRRDLHKYIVAVQEGRGPLVVLKGSKVAGFFIAPQHYEQMFGAAVEELLGSRMSGPTATQDEVRAAIRKQLSNRRMTGPKAALTK